MYFKQEVILWQSSVMVGAFILRRSKTLLFLFLCSVRVGILSVIPAETKLTINAQYAERK